MDQIVFVLDLESFLPDVLDDVDDSTIETTLSDVRKALLRIITHGRVIERRRDLSSFGFRWEFIMRSIISLIVCCVSGFTVAQIIFPSLRS